MTISARALALPTALILALSAGTLTATAGSAPVAKTAVEGQAVVTELGGDAKAFTYWSDRPEGWLVVTTVDTVSGVDSDAERHAVVRFSSLLKPGQSLEVSIPQAMGAEAHTLHIERQDTGLAVALAAE